MSNAPKNLLQIVQAAQAELGLPVASTVIGNTDTATTQMLYLLNNAGEELRDTPEMGWTALQTEFDLVVSPPVITTGNLTLDSPVITNLGTTTGIVAGMFTVQASGVPVAARILSVDSLTQVTMTMEATGTVAGTSFTFSRDTYSFPTDFKFQLNKTWWDRTNRWALLGPMSPQEDQWHRSGIVTTGPRRFFRVLGHSPNGTYRIWPPPAEITAPLQFALEYISTDWVNVNNANVTTASAFANDADTPFLDDRALIMSLKWRYWQIKGYNYTGMQGDYVDFVDRLIARDGAAPTLSMYKRRANLLLSTSNIADGFWPGPTGPNTA